VLGVLVLTAGVACGGFFLVGLSVF
jgi:hypothetical protein